MWSGSQSVMRALDIASVAILGVLMAKPFLSLVCRFAPFQHVQNLNFQNYTKELYYYHDWSYSVHSSAFHNSKISFSSLSTWPVTSPQSNSTSWSSPSLQKFPYLMPHLPHKCLIRYSNFSLSHLVLLPTQSLLQMIESSRSFIVNTRLQIP